MKRKPLLTSYDKGELYEMWLRFRDDPDAKTILSDFAMTTKNQAAELIAEFEIKHEAETLNAEMRGKSGHSGRVIH